MGDLVAKTAGMVCRIVFAFVSETLLRVFLIKYIYKQKVFVQ